MTASTLKPPRVEGCTIAFPYPHILLLTLSRPQQMNSITHTMNWSIQNLFTWFDNEPSLRVAVITGSGTKAFCAGSDLIEIEQTRKAMVDGEDLKTAQPWLHEHPRGGFAGVSRRRGKKPYLCAVNGVALGGGFEIVLNSDITLASPTATFGLPEATVGVYAYGGGLPRLVRTIGMQLASDIALTGRRIPASEALRLNLISGISQSPLEDTLAKARQIAAISPDGIRVTREALREAWETGSVERAFQITHEGFFEGLMRGENSGEGLAAFREKRGPRWREGKL